MGTVQDPEAESTDLSKIRSGADGCLLRFFIPGYGVEKETDIVYNSIGLVSSLGEEHKILKKVVQ